MEMSFMSLLILYVNLLKNIQFSLFPVEFRSMNVIYAACMCFFFLHKNDDANRTFFLMLTVKTS